MDELARGDVGGGLEEDLRPLLGNHSLTFFCP